MKLQQQFARHGTSLAGMPPIELKRGSDGELVIYDGVTRAVRTAKYCPGQRVPAEVTGILSGPVGGLPTVGDRL